jgi:selenophosphate synthase
MPWAASLKYALIGVIHPEKYWTNTGARPADARVLTKPLGSGVLFNANLKKWVSTAQPISSLHDFNKHARLTLIHRLG